MNSATRSSISGKPSPPASSALSGLPSERTLLTSPPSFHLTTGAGMTHASPSTNASLSLHAHRDAEAEKNVKAMSLFVFHRQMPPPSERKHHWDTFLNRLHFPFTAAAMEKKEKEEATKMALNNTNRRRRGMKGIEGERTDHPPPPSSQAHHPMRSTSTASSFSSSSSSSPQRRARHHSDGEGAAHHVGEEGGTSQERTPAPPHSSSPLPFLDATTAIPTTTHAVPPVSSTCWFPSSGEDIRTRVSQVRMDQFHRPSTASTTSLPFSTWFHQKAMEVEVRKRKAALLQREAEDASRLYEDGGARPSSRTMAGNGRGGPPSSSLSSPSPLHASAPSTSIASCAALDPFWSPLFPVGSALPRTPFSIPTPPTRTAGQDNSEATPTSEWGNERRAEETRWEEWREGERAKRPTRPTKEEKEKGASTRTSAVPPREVLLAASCRTAYAADDLYPSHPFTTIESAFPSHEGPPPPSPIPSGRPKGPMTPPAWIGPSPSRDSLSISSKSSTTSSSPPPTHSRPSAPPGGPSPTRDEPAGRKASEEDEWERSSRSSFLAAMNVEVSALEEDEKGTPASYLHFLDPLSHPPYPHPQEAAHLYSVPLPLGTNDVPPSRPSASPPPQMEKEAGHEGGAVGKSSPPLLQEAEERNGGGRRALRTPLPPPSVAVTAAPCPPSFAASPLGASDGLAEYPYGALEGVGEGAVNPLPSLPIPAPLFCTPPRTKSMPPTSLPQGGEKEKWAASELPSPEAVPPSPPVRWPSSSSFSFPVASTAVPPALPRPAPHPLLALLCADSTSSSVCSLLPPPPPLAAVAAPSSSQRRATSPPHLPSASSSSSSSSFSPAFSTTEATLWQEKWETKVRRMEEKFRVVEDRLAAEQQRWRNEMEEVQTKEGDIWSTRYRPLKAVLEELDRFAERVRRAKMLYRVVAQEEGTVRTAHLALLLERTTMKLLLKEIKTLAEDSLALGKEAKQKVPHRHLDREQEEEEEEETWDHCAEDVVEEDSHLATLLLACFPPVS